MKSILLFSSGKESIYNLHKGSEYGIELLLLFNYGQKAFLKELKGLKYYSDKFKIPYEVVSMPFLNVPKGIVSGVKTVEGSEVVFRNPLFISIAVNKAKELGCTNVMLGAFKNLLYNDGSSLFVKDFEKLTKKLVGVTLRSPSRKAYPKSIIKYLVKEADISHIWFCESDGEEHCGVCNKCTIFVEESKSVIKSKQTKQLKELLKL